MLCIGEIAAAFTAGYLSAEDAIRIAYYRGKVVASTSAKGEMLAVGLGAEEVSMYLESCQDTVVIGCYNSPKSVTLSGDADAVRELKQHLEARDIFARNLRTDGKAYHSHHMVLAASKYKMVLEAADICSVAVPRKERRCRMISTVSNSLVDDETMDSAYWAANLESPVLFSQAIHTLTKEAPDLDMLVEIGPHPALFGPIRHISAHMDKPLSYMPTLKRDQDDIDQLLTLAGELWTRKYSIVMSAVTSIERSLTRGNVEEISGSLLVDLPPYQWNHAKKYLSEPRQSREHRACKHPRHDILGRRLHGLSASEPQWRNILRLEDIPWLKHHNVSTSLTNVASFTNAECTAR